MNKHVVTAVKVVFVAAMMWYVSTLIDFDDRLVTRVDQEVVATEVIDIRTPHLGRTIEWFRLDGDRLELVAELPGFTSHVIGSRNLELAIVADPDGDGRLEVVASSPDRLVLSVVARTDDGADIEATVDLGARLSSNIGAVDHADGGASYAVGTDDGLVRFWLS